MEPLSSTKAALSRKAKTQSVSLANTVEQSEKSTIARKESLPGMCLNTNMPWSTSDCLSLRSGSGTTMLSDEQSSICLLKLVSSPSPNWRRKCSLPSAKKMSYLSSMCLPTLCTESALSLSQQLRHCQAKPTSYRFPKIPNAG